MRFYFRRNYYYSYLSVCYLSYQSSNRLVFFAVCLYFHRGLMDSLAVGRSELSHFRSRSECWLGSWSVVAMQLLFGRARAIIQQPELMVMQYNVWCMGSYTNKTRLLLGRGTTVRQSGAFTVWLRELFEVACCPACDACFVRMVGNGGSVNVNEGPREILHSSIFSGFSLKSWESFGYWALRTFQFRLGATALVWSVRMILYWITKSIRIITVEKVSFRRYHYVKYILEKIYDRRISLITIGNLIKWN